MTDEERRNRNPAPEITRTTLAELEATHPIVKAAQLELHRVYIVQSAKYIATLNYMGAALAGDEFGVALVHHFHGPRVLLDVFLAAQPDGSFTDANGTRITVRRWMGDDQ